ncbi:interferon alpha/beta receptor 2-like isoform X3 [Seriola dumerili]|uniref:interferon alpha/beta receptor 2-like isoform X3 n=1 Tax=Seriola dumerili TaxID=41447 RepID=UPI000BBF1C4D|nr:interferon alpha/beta receptor 2-like isoform X3 [Seriola dumerili]
MCEQRAAAVLRLVSHSHHLPTSPSLPSTWSIHSASSQVLGPPPTPTSVSKSSARGIHSTGTIKSSWRPVVGCLELKAAQMCNLTTAFKDPYTQYRARVQAFTATQTSNWTVSGWFQPLSDTVLGPPGVSVSGCGNCLILQLRLPVTRGGQQNLQLENLYRTVELHVQRTRDETQFRLSLPYKEETVITYLQPGVEYCVTITVTTHFTSNSVSSRPYCAFTSPPPPTTSAYLVFGLLGASCVLGLFFIGLMVHGSWLSSSRTLLQNKDSTNCLLTAHSPTPPLRSCSEGGRGRL